MPLFNVPTGINNTSSTATPTTVGATIESTTILLANSARKGATVLNASSANLYLDFQAEASESAYLVRLAAGSYYEIPFAYTGVISGIWDAANGNAEVRELT